MESGALRLGFAGNLVLAFLFIPVTRGSSILPLVGLTSEGSIKYHIWMGHIAMLLFTLHGLFYVIVWGSADKLIKVRKALFFFFFFFMKVQFCMQLLEWDPRDVSNLAGVIALLSGFVLWATTLKPLRRKMFEVFFYGHHFYVLFMLFFLLHVGIGFVFYVLPGIYLFMVDRFLRFLQSRNRVRLVSARLLPGDTVELNFAKSPSERSSSIKLLFILIIILFAATIIILISIVTIMFAMFFLLLSCPRHLFLPSSLICIRMIMIIKSMTMNWIIILLLMAIIFILIIIFNFLFLLNHQEYSHHNHLFLRHHHDRDGDHDHRRDHHLPFSFSYFICIIIIMMTIR